MKNGVIKSKKCRKFYINKRLNDGNQRSMSKGFSIKASALHSSAIFSRFCTADINTIGKSVISSLFFNSAQFYCLFFTEPFVQKYQIRFDRRNIIYNFRVACYDYFNIFFLQDYYAAVCLKNLHLIGLTNFS